MSFAIGCRNIIIPATLFWLCVALAVYAACVGRNALEWTMGGAAVFVLVAFALALWSESRK